VLKQRAVAPLRQSFIQGVLSGSLRLQAIVNPKEQPVYGEICTKPAPFRYLWVRFLQEMSIDGRRAARGIARVETPRLKFANART
jgi:hypothetical protein